MASILIADNQKQIRRRVNRWWTISRICFRSENPASAAF
jgi:hypothetical protein